MRRTGTQVPKGASSAGVLLAILLCSGPAWAQDDEFADEDSAAATEDEPSATAAASNQPPASALGVGFRTRGVILPEGMLELFIEEVPGGVFQPAFGLEVIRRKGQFDVVFGLDYHSLEAECPEDPEPCLYLEKGDDASTSGEYPDDVEFDGFGMIGLDVAFVWHEPITDFFSLRYGAGLGLGIILGEVRQTDTICSPGPTDTIQEPGRCIPVTSGGQIDEPNEDIPPVVPIVQAMFGGRFDIIENLSLNVEVGFRNLLYFGGGVAYFF